MDWLQLWAMLKVAGMVLPPIVLIALLVWIGWTNRNSD